MQIGCDASAAHNDKILIPETLALERECSSTNTMGHNNSAPLYSVLFVRARGREERNAAAAACVAKGAQIVGLSTNKTTNYTQRLRLCPVFALLLY